MMVSKRTFAIISMMMAVLFFLFFFSGVMKETLNDYDVNHHYEASTLKKATEWKVDKNASADIVLIGSKKDSKLAAVVSQWCGYTKRKLEICGSVGAYKKGKTAPELLLLDSNGINFEKDLATIRKWVDGGSNVFFCNLPKPSVIDGNKKLAELLGIQAVYVDKVDIKGVELFGGFLLGGDVIYKAEKASEKELQDFDLQVPWFQTTSGTKTYMVGMMDKEKVMNEYMPGILWRNSIGDAKVFVMNGDLMESLAGIGLLSGAITECRDYDLYPIVNAQNLSLVNFPGFADENQKKMQEIYSRSLPALHKDIVWPAIQALMEKTDNRITCFLNFQYDYEDKTEPETSDYVYYLKSINEVKGEAALDTARVGKTSVKTKLEKDRSLLTSMSSEYVYDAYHATKKDLKDTLALAGTDAAKNMKTVVTEYTEGDRLFYYAGDDLTVQMATIDGTSHTYKEDVRVRALETALGYSNIMVDFYKIAWPESKKDHFEKVSERFSSYVATYWNPFDAFDFTTVSESDRRIRNYLALDYDVNREKNVIRLDLKNVDDVTWFLLRTHGETIDDISGGTYQEMEEDVYLIQTEKNHVEIQLEENDGENYYK